LLLKNNFLHECFKTYYSTNYITYCITTFIVVKIIIGQVVFFLLVIINYKYNKLLNIKLIFIITVKLLLNIYHSWLITNVLVIIIIITIIVFVKLKSVKYLF
jgi:hypothetical protein